MSGQIAGQQALEIFAETERDFFVRATNLRLTFEAEGDGKAPAVILHQPNGRDVRAARVADEPPKSRTEVKVDPAIFDRYLGRYQFATLVVTVTRDGDRLFAQVAGQQKYEIFPESEKSYFYKVVDAQVTFETDGQGRAGAAVLRQAGREFRLTRVQE
jgi:hypothetical protein